MNEPIYGWECLNPDPEECGGIFEIVFRAHDGTEIAREQNVAKCPLCGGPVKGLTEDEYEALVSEEEV